MNWEKHIVSYEGVLLGKPSIKGTRISVDHLIKLLSMGWSEEEILNNFPRLNKEKLNAVFAYVYECIQDGLLQTHSKRIA